MCKYDVPVIVHDILKKAEELGIIDITEAYTMGVRFHNDWNGVVQYIISTSVIMEYKEGINILTPYIREYNKLKIQKEKRQRSSEI